MAARVVTTRPETGRLEELLAAAGLEVVHVPLIEIVDAADGGAALADALDALAAGDWLVVTSQHGARRVGAAAAARPGVRLAAVGTRTAEELAALAGRPVDVVPEHQTGADLVAALPPAAPGTTAVIAQADQADGAVAGGLERLGYRVLAVTAYRTVARRPTEADRARVLAAEVLALASGSAARAWAAAFGPDTPPVVAAIGPTTAAAAEAAGLDVTHVAASHSVEGLAATITGALG